MEEDEAADGLSDIVEESEGGDSHPGHQEPRALLGQVVEGTREA